MSLAKRFAAGPTRGIKTAIITTGDDELTKALGFLPEAMQSKAVAHATQRLAKKIRPTVVALAPTGKPQLRGRERIAHQPGTLKISIKAKAMKRKIIQGQKRVGWTVISGEGWFKGPTYYAGFVEMGTSKMKARRFFRRAYLQHRPSARRDFQRLLKAKLPEVARDALRKSGGKAR